MKTGLIGKFFAMLTVFIVLLTVSIVLVTAKKGVNGVFVGIEDLILLSAVIGSGCIVIGYLNGVGTPLESHMICDGKIVQLVSVARVNDSDIVFLRHESVSREIVVMLSETDSTLKPGFFYRVKDGKLISAKD